MARRMARLDSVSKQKRREYGAGAVYRRHGSRYGCPDLIDGPLDPETGKPTKVRPEHEKTCRGPWVGTIEVGSGSNRKRATVEAKTEGEAKRRLRKRKGDLETGASTSVNPRTTVEQWAQEWLAITEKTLRPKSWRADEGAVRNWIVPAIGRKRLNMLEPNDHRAVMAKLRAAGRQGSMVRVHATFQTMLKAAKLEGHAVSERMLLVKAPEPTKSDRQDMSVPQALAMIEQAGTLHHGSRFLAAFLEGVRQGEALGLTWDQLDFDRGLMDISWQLQALPYRVKRDTASGFRIPDGFECRQLAGALHLVKPKTESGERIIPMIPFMQDALERWREVQADLIPDNPHNLVWPNLDGSPTVDRTDNEEWAALQCAAGISHPRPATHPKGPRWFTIHEARHTTATLLLECGVDEATIIAIMGHASILSTKKYQHVRTERALAALEKVGRMLQLGQAA